MMRLLVVMAVLMLAVTYMIMNEKSDGEAASAPEQVYREQTQKVEDLERQLQEQANRQLEQIDAAN